MTLVLEQCSPVTIVIRQATILLRGVRPSLGWLAGATPPAADEFDDARLLGWRVGCRMLARRVADAPGADRADDPLLAHLADWVDFELRADAARWTHVRPVAMLGASVFEDLADRTDPDLEILDAWTSTLRWCLGRCHTGEMEVHLDDMWLLEAWIDRADEVRGGQGIADLVRSISSHATPRASDWAPAPLLRAADVSLMQVLFEHGTR